MAKTNYRVILSADGNHKVEANTDDPAELTTALDQVKNAYKWLEYYIQQGELHKIREVVPARPQTDKPAASETVPVCAIHEVPMKWIDKNGGFWSCHEKADDGSWCKYRPPKAVV